MRRRPILECLEARRLLAADWQNPWRPLDVNDDNVVSPIDALLGINRLNTEMAGDLPARQNGSSEPYYDTNGDGYHSPIDILLVINTLNGGLKVQASLQDDTGQGEAANTDGFTNNPAIRVFTSGNPDVLRARVGQGDWQDISSLAINKDAFEITGTRLGEISGSDLVDGRYRVEIEAGYSTPRSGLVDRAFVEFELDRAGPTSHVVGSVQMKYPGTIEVYFNEPVSVASLDPGQLRLYDVTWGEKADDPNWGLDGQHPRFPVQVQSVRLSENSQRLTVNFPGANRSAKYRLELRNLVEDRAGNSFTASTSEGVELVEANYLSGNVPSLVFGNTYRNLIQNEARILEYRFNLESASTLLWSGDAGFGSLARYELFDGDGNLWHQFWPGTIQDPGDAQRPALIHLPSGEFRLRVVEPPSSLSFFRIYAADQLPELPNDRSSGNADLWPWDAYSVDLNEGERLFAQSLDGQIAIQTVFDAHGQKVSLSSDGVNQYFDASLAGRHTVLMNRVGYRIHRSTPSLAEVNDLSVPVSGTLDKPGQVADFDLRVTPNALYVLRPQLDNGIQLDVNFNDGEVQQLGDEWLIKPNGGRLRLQFQRLSALANRYEFELRFDELTLAPSLPVGEWRDVPDLGQSTWYRLPEDTNVGFEGEREFTFVSNLNAQLRISTVFGASIYTPSPELSGSAFVRVGGSDAATPWRATLPETVTSELGFDTPNRVDFETGMETFSSEFLGDFGEFVTAELAAPTQSVLASLNADTFELLDPSGRKIPKVDGLRPANLWQLDRPGKYRLQLKNTFGPQVMGSGSIIASRDNSWQELPIADEQRVTPGSSRYYTIPSDVRTLVLDPATENGNQGANWRVFDQAGRVLMAASHSQIKLEWLDLPVGNQYYLAVINENAFESFEFRQLGASLDNSETQIGETFNAALQDRGDRLRVSIELERGQRIRWAGVPWGNEGQVHASLLGPSFESIQLTEHVSLPYPAVWLVPDSGVYTIELRNASDISQEISFLINLEEASELGSGVTGFDTLYEGTVVRTELNDGFIGFPIEVEARTAVLFDWLQDEYGPFYAGFTNPSIWTPEGVYVTQFSQFAQNQILTIEEAGRYELRLRLDFGNESSSYKFMLRDLSTAREITPGQILESVSIEPFEARLYQLKVPAVVDLELVASNQSTATIELQNLSPGMKSTTSSAAGNYSYASGTHAVVVSSIADVTSVFGFTFKPVDHERLLLMDRESRVTLSAGSNRFQFYTSSPLTQVLVSVPVEDASVEIFDRAGTAVLPSESGEYRLSQAEAYTSEVMLPSNSPPRRTTLSVATIPPAQTQYQLGDSFQQAGLVLGQQLGFSISIPTDGLYVWRVDGAMDFELQNAIGQTVPLRQVVEDNGLVRGPRVMQYLRAGEYTLWSTAASDKLYLYIAAFSELPEIGLGQIEGTLEAGEFERFYRMPLQVGQRILLEPGNGASILFMTEGMLVPDDASPNALVSAENSEELLMWARSNADSQGSGRQYQVTISAEPQTVEVPMGFGERVTFELKPFQSSVMSFVLDKPSSLFFETNLTTFDLVYPSGYRLAVTESNPSSVWFNLPAGEYSILPSLSNRAQSVHATLFDFDEVPHVDLPFDGLVRAGQLLGFQVLETGDFLLSVSNSGGKTISDLSLWNSSGERLQLADRTPLNRGQYWFVSQGDEDFSLNVAPIAVTNFPATAGELLQIETTTTNDALVQYTIRAGDLVDLPLVAVDSGVSVHFRLAPIGVAHEWTEGWLSLDQWVSPRLVRQDSKLEFLITGTGGTSLQLIDLRQSPVVEFNQLQQLTHIASYRRSFWKLDINEAGPHLFANLFEPGPDTEWWIVDSMGRRLTSLEQGTAYSFGRLAEHYLEFRSDTTIDLDLELSLEIISP